MNQLHRGLIAVAAAAALVVTASSAEAARLMRGTIKRVDTAQNQIVVTDEAGKDHLFTLVDGGKISLGVAAEQAIAKLTDLKPESKVNVTYVTINDGLYATAITGRDKDEAGFQQMTGTLKEVSRLKKQFVLTGPDGKDLLFTLTDDYKIQTSDKEEGSLFGLRAGEKATVTYVKLKGGLYATAIRASK
jgi:hypothetical protein